jgi:hypothetical protein
VVFWLADLSYGDSPIGVAGGVVPAVPNDTPVKIEASSESTAPISHVNTDLVFLEGSTKLLLTNQRPIIRAIVQDAIEHLRCSLLVRNAFPDPVIAFAFTKDALRLAAERCDKPGGSIIQFRLQEDDEYITKLVSLVSELTSQISRLMFNDSPVHGSP